MGHMEDAFKYMLIGFMWSKGIMIFDDKANTDKSIRFTSLQDGDLVVDIIHEGDFRSTKVCVVLDKGQALELIRGLNARYNE